MALVELLVWEEGREVRRRRMEVVVGVLQTWETGSVLEMVEDSEPWSVLASGLAQAQ